MTVPQRGDGQGTPWDGVDRTGETMQFYVDPSFFMLLVVALVPAVVLGALGRRIRTYGLLVSLAFLVGLFWGDWLGLGLALGYMLVTFATTRLVLARTVSDGQGAVTSPAPLALRLLALAACLVPLVTYKLTVSFGQGLLGFVGISYITFRATQVLLEVTDGLIDRVPFVDYLYFLSFFPTFTSGPIDRSRRFFADAERTLDRWEYLDRLGRGILMVLVGLVMELVLATIAQKFDVPAALDLTKPIVPQLGSAVVVAYAYAAYLYFDFAGYSLMAQGVGLALGVDVPRNFNLPFLSCSMQEFWDRWNITLSHWLRDFAFMRLERTMARHRLPKGRDTRASVGLVANMLLMGAWHGITPAYLTYGLYHGVLLALEQRLHRHWKFWRKHKDDRAVRIASWFVTLQLVVFGLSIFSGQLFTFLGGIHG